MPYPKSQIQIRYARERETREHRERRSSAHLLT